MKTYEVIISVSTPVNDYKFKLVVIASSAGHANSVAEREFPKLEPQMTTDNECNFYVTSVDEMEDHQGSVLSCEEM